MNLVKVTSETLHYIEDWLNGDRELRILARLSPKELE